LFIGNVNIFLILIYYYRYIIKYKKEIKMTTFLKSTAVLLSMSPFDYCLANAATQQQATPQGKFFLTQATQEVVVPATGGDGTAALVDPNGNIVLTKCNPINGCKKN